MSDATAAGAEVARQWFEHSPFAQELGMRLIEVVPDGARVELPFREGLATLGDVVHGGAIGALADTAAAFAAWSSHEPGEDTKWGTIGMSLNFLAPGRGADADGGRPRHATRKGHVLLPGGRERQRRKRGCRGARDLPAGLT